MGVPGIHFGQGTSGRTVEEAIAFFSSETIKIISELEKISGSQSKLMQDRIATNLVELQKFVNELDKYSKSVGYLRDKHRTAIPDGKFAKKFNKLQNSFQTIVAESKEINRVDPPAQKPRIENPLITQESQNISKLEEKMDEWIVFQRTDLLINSISILLSVVTLIILVSIIKRKYNGNNHDTGELSEEIKTINSVLSNLQHKIDLIVEIKSSNEIPEIKEKLNEIDRTLDVVASGMKNILAKHSTPASSVLNNPSVVSPAPPVQQTQVNPITSSGRLFNTSNPPRVEEVSRNLVNYTVENMQDVHSDSGLTAPVFVKNADGECLINENTGELTIEGRYLSELDDPSIFLSKFFELRGNASSRSSLNYKKKARVKRDGQKWVLTEKGILE